ncbi:MAG: hypothetical protein N3E38_02315 [Candidatus Aenigmarchaeota archaeon]|nr:hypothetical protein [Candidatus Aenigmarchaeota archaeon]
MPRAILVCFSINTKKFSSSSERNKFFKELYGWKQIIKRNKRNYEYRREGILDKIPHIRVDQSIFIILETHLKLMQEFFREWEDKIRWEEFEVLLDEERIKYLEGEL